MRMDRAGANMRQLPGILTCRRDLGGLFGAASLDGGEQ